MQFLDASDYVSLLLAYRDIFRPPNAMDTGYWWSFDKVGTNARILSLLLAADMAEDGML